MVGSRLDQDKQWLYCCDYFLQQTKLQLLRVMAEADLAPTAKGSSEWANFHLAFVAPQPTTFAPNQFQLLCCWIQFYTISISFSFSFSFFCSFQLGLIYGHFNKTAMSFHGRAIAESNQDLSKRSPIFRR